MYLILNLRYVTIVILLQSNKVVMQNKLIKIIILLLKRFVFIIRFRVPNPSGFLVIEIERNTLLYIPDVLCIGLIIQRAQFLYPQVSLLRR